MSDFPVLFKADLIFKDFSRKPSKLKYFSSLCEPCTITPVLIVLIHMGNKGEVGAVKHVYSSAFFFLLTVPRRCFFCGSFILFAFHVCHAVLSVLCSLVVTCRERADLLALLYVMFSCVFVTFPYGVLGLMLYLIVSIPDLCLLPYFKRPLKTNYRLMRVNSIAECSLGAFCNIFNLN